MKVDVQVLRDFSSTTSEAADTIDSNSLAGRIVGAFAGMQGSTSAWASHHVDAFAADAIAKLSNGFRALATSARGAADSFEVADTELAEQIDRTFVS